MSEIAHGALLLRQKRARDFTLYMAITSSHMFSLSFVRSTNLCGALLFDSF